MNLLEAWHHLTNKQDWQLVIAGPDEGNYQAVLEVKVKELKLMSSVQFVGPVEGAYKWQLYREAAVFVLPTLSENFGIVIPEALLAGTPVITTQEAPWSDLITYRCGWWIDVGVEPLLDALQAAMAMPAEQLAKLGQRGQSLIQEKYTWPQIARQMLDLYQWILGVGSKPQFIVED